jgi:hypothetical protein
MKNNSQNKLTPVYSNVNNKENVKVKDHSEIKVNPEFVNSLRQAKPFLKDGKYKETVTILYILSHFGSVYTFEKELQNDFTFKNKLKIISQILASDKRISRELSAQELDNYYRSCKIMESEGFLKYFQLDLSAET